MRSISRVAFIDASEMVRSAPLRGWSGRFFHSENMTFAHWDIAADAADLHEHEHLQEEVWNVVEGQVVLVVGGCEKRLGPGMAAVVAPNTPHSVKPVGACRVIVTDYPVRHDLPGVRDL
jgi:mannose-6-phosphate isomerase-like protein (cupin superfamily)